MFNEMRSENAIGPDMASNVLRDLWRRAIADDLASHAMDMINGRVTSMMPLREMIEQHEEDFMPGVRVNFDETDLEFIRKQVSLTFRWKVNIPTLADMWPGVNEGQLVVGAARPNRQTSSIAHLVSGPEGFIDQVQVCTGNEEATPRVTSRHMNAATSLSIKEIFDSQCGLRQRAGRQGQQLAEELLHHRCYRLGHRPHGSCHQASQA